MDVPKAVLILFTATLIWQASTHGIPTPSSLKPASTSQVLGTTSPVTSTTKLLTSSSSELARVTRVIDGDTIELEGGARVRYIGINTPETVDPRTSVQCFGVESSNANKSLVEGQQVRLEKDISDTDKYHRLLRYVWIGDKLVNDYLVRQGFATVSTYPPDVKYQTQFIEAQNQAQAGNLGLWGSCNKPGAPVTQPTPTQVSSKLSISPDPSCVIKGNITSSGKIYHLPGQRYYAKTIIDTAAGERWFCTEAQAVEAGWRKSKL